jgi:glycosidase
MATHFNTVAWANGGSIYEVNIRQYTPEGTFKAFQQHLPRLKDMGITIIWLMPITPISKAKRQGILGSYYACSSYTTINPEFGTLDDFKELIHATHDLGLKIIIDWVANHTGYDHHWTIENPDYYIKDEDGNFTEKNGWEDVIDLDFFNQNMQAELINAMQYWVRECNIDGFRCDMAHLVPLSFWKEARLHCDAVKKLFWLAECEEVTYHDVFDVSYSWAWMHATEKYFKKEGTLHDVMHVLHQYAHYPHGSKKLFFTSNHDENSWNGTEYEKYNGAAKALAVFTCTWSGMPLIYSGQESPNYKRIKFFDKDLIQWHEPLQLHQFYKALLSLNKHKAITHGETFILPVTNNQVLAYFRKKEEEVVLVLLNLSSEYRTIVEVNHEWLKGQFTSLFSKLTYQFSGKQTFELQANEYIVYHHPSLKI